MPPVQGSWVLSRCTELLDRPPLPCTPWPSCKPTRLKRWSSCTRAVLTQVWCRSCARWRTMPFEQQKSQRGHSVRRCPLWWSRSATYGWTWQIWGNSTSTASWTPQSPRQASLAMLWRAWPSFLPHRSRRRWSDNKACPGGPLLSPPAAGCSPLPVHCRGRPPAAPPPPLQCGSAALIPSAAWSRQQGIGAVRLYPCQAREAPEQAASLGRANPRHWILLFRRWWVRSFPWMMSPLLHCFCCSATGSSAGGTQTFKKAVSYVSGSQERTDSSVQDTVSTPPSPSPFVSRQQVPVRGRDASSLTPCPTGKPGKCRTTQSEPTSGRTVFRVESLCSTSLPQRGYVGGSPSISSVCLASSQVQGRSVHYCAEPGCSRLANGDCGPTGKGCDRASPSSWFGNEVLQPLLHCTQERRWAMTNLGPAKNASQLSLACFINTRRWLGSRRDSMTLRLHSILQGHGLHM